jgi:hypothetical protein
MANVKAEVRLNVPRILNKVENDKFGLFLAHEWKRLINPYTPHKTGNLERNVEYRPFEIEYLSPYSQYQYYGMLYVDPLYRVGGFTKDGGITWFSRPGIKKVATTTPLNYLKDHNPMATSKWDVAAEKAGQKQKLIKAANLYLKRL